MARKKKKKPDIEPEDDDLDDETSETKPAKPLKAKPRSDAYVGMLAITFIALAAAAFVLYSDTESLSAQSVSPPSVSVPDLGGK